MNAEHIVVLRATAQEQPRSSLDAVTRELFRRSGVKVNPVTVRKALREAGIERLKPMRRASERAAQGRGAGVRTGCTQAHRCSDGASGLNTDLTDAQQPLWPEELAKGFVVQAKRWGVERTHAWNERCRRLIVHQDRSDWAPVAWAWLAEARIPATRLAT